MNTEELILALKSTERGIYELQALVTGGDYYTASNSCGDLIEELNEIRLTLVYWSI
jgi:hypothetical protein